MSEHDQRQLRLMLDRLTGFEGGGVPLDRLVVDLDGLINVLEEVKPSWKQHFLHDWGKLEDERAFALFKGLSVFDDETTERIRRAIAQLKLLILEEIDDPADGFRSR